MSPDGTLPLEGIRVVDLTRNVAGPYTSMILAELGAEVVKIERPGTGDDIRSWGPPFWGDDSAMFLSLNRNKRSIELDLRSDEGRQVLSELVTRSDVVVESFRPGSLARMGYSYAWAAQLNPGIVFCHITSYGSVGPMKDLPGYDLLMQALSGIMSVTGEAGRPAVRVGVSVVDMGTGMWGAMAVLSALQAKQRTGKGSEVQTSLFETAISWMSYHLTAYLASGEIPRKLGTGNFSLAPYGTFRAADGEVAIGAGNDSLFRRLCGVLQRPELASDERFVTNPLRVQNRASLTAELEQVTSNWPSEKLVQALYEGGVPASLLRTVDQVATEPQVQALGILQRFERCDIPYFRSVGLPLTFDGIRPPLRLFPPRVGQHNDWLREQLKSD
jgi:crotonobetainyl-CoA:carnitine CoA-transferase CaiB-like acyl-CoA transferase